MEMPLYERTFDGNCRFLGFRMCQNRLAVAVLSYIIETGRFARVIELGTELGGLTALLGLQCHLMDIHIDTFDHQDRTLYQEWFERFGIRFHLLDIFSDEGLAVVGNLIGSPCRILLLCDDGDKVREFNTFAPFLKPGDVIAAHDYHPEDEIDERRWGWKEISDRDVEETCARYGLVPFLPEAGREAAWLMRTKR